MGTRIIFAVLAFCCMSLTGLAQDYSSLKDIPLKDKSDYSAAEPKVQECSKYIMSSPVDMKNINQLYCFQFLMKWMEGTPDYTFSIDDTIGSLIKSNESLLGVYLACMTTYVLEHKDKSKDQKEVKYNSISMLLDYCTDSNNHIKSDKVLNEMIQAKKTTN